MRLCETGCAPTRWCNPHGHQPDAFSAQVDAEIAASLRTTHKKLGLRQVEAGLLFGGGSCAFSEYERGKTQPHKSTMPCMKRPLICIG
ncbi:type II toxin-antitoxin system MqsA family antitoxin [Rhodoferax sp.]|uniref:type II toxin-antitoxin system MqsA family antitoxin n=1 Tax=Rhodoferax sp. TaxID=50421 RepID=UPI002634A146|nr:type II toxin-antitoxin system MqsA family antitoxin [Rhodoferax sp.]MDD2811172.1 type II toxin-antitoxin system MqsA family antitoxin [Rhodoferax sp.]